MSEHTMNEDTMNGFTSDSQDADSFFLQQSRTFLFFEWRRHLPMLVLGWSLLLVVPLVHRLVVGHWKFWGDDWNLLTALFSTVLIVPSLAIFMAVSGWATERGEGSLGWLYARPMSTAQLFGLRLLAIFLALALWTGLAMAFLGVSAGALSKHPFLAPHRFEALWLVCTGLGLGVGLFTSALAKRPWQAVGQAYVISLGALLAVPFALAWFLPTRAVLLHAKSSLLSLATGCYAAVLAVALLWGAWYAMRRSPENPKRWRSALAAAGPLLLVAAATLVFWLLLPLQTDLTEPQRVVFMGADTTLTFAPARGIEAPIMHPVLRHADGREQVLSRTFAFSTPVFAHPGSGRALVPEIDRFGFGKAWLSLHRDGTVKHLEIPPSRPLKPLGFSPAGSKFLWRHWFTSGSQGELVVLDENQELRGLWFDTSHSRSPWVVAWLDENHLLVTTDGSLRNAQSPGWWMVIPTAGDAAVAPQELPDGSYLFSPTISPTPRRSSRIYSFEPSPQAHYGGDPVFLLGTLQKANQLATLDLAESRLELSMKAPDGSPLGPEPCAPVQACLVSLGNLDDETLVWAAPTGRRHSWVYSLAPGNDVPEKACKLEHSDDSSIGRFLGTTGRWAVWANAQEDRLFACQPATGEVRVLKKNLGPLGTRSVDVMADGILTPQGKIVLD